MRQQGMVRARLHVLWLAAYAALVSLTHSHSLGAVITRGQPSRLCDMSPKWLVADASLIAAQRGRSSGVILGDRIGDTIEMIKCNTGRAADAVGKVFSVPTGLIVMAAGWVGIGSSPRKSQDLIGWYRPKRTKDITHVFACMLSAVKAKSTVLPNKYTYLFVPGFMWRRYPGYFWETLKHFQKKGLSARIADVRSEGGLHENSATVYKLVKQIWEEEQKLTVLVGHSKGGLDSLCALAEYKELAALVRGLVCIQSPFGGSPIATDIVHGPHFIRDAVSVGLTSIFGGDFACINDLTHKRRQEFFARHGCNVNQVATLCFSSATESLFSFVSAPAMYIKRIYGEISDGLVPLKDSVLSGAYTVQPEGDIHHLAPVMPSPPWGYNIQNMGHTKKCIGECRGHGRDQMVFQAAELNEAIVGTLLFVSSMGREGRIPKLKDGLKRVHDKW